MSATIGAALKKIAVYLFTNPKVIKTIGGIVIGIIIIVVMPIIAVVSVFNGSMDIDTDKLNQSIQENIYSRAYGKSTAYQRHNDRG